MPKGRILSPIFLFIALLIAVLLISNRQSSAALFGDPDEFAGYLPVVNRSVDTDMAITNMEIIQAVQRADNSVPLVANKEAYARIYASMVAGSSPNNVLVRLTARRNGETLGNETATLNIVPNSTSRGTLNSTVNIPLPASWLTGNVQLTAQVDANNQVNEISEANNSVEVNANFVNVPDLNVRIVPVQYRHTNGTTYSNPSNADPFSDWLIRAYPVGNVNISHNASHFFDAFSIDDGNLASSNGNSWINLLQDITDIRRLSGFSNDTVFYGLVPIGSGGSQWFFSGIAGIGWIGFPRASVGLNLGNNDNTGALAGHEIGHNFGRSHAPCGGAGGPDANYPYANGIVGEYGLDISGGNFELTTPNGNNDVMGYCPNEWVSDYTYEALFVDQVNSFRQLGISTAKQLYVQASITEDGTVTLSPAYVLDMPLQAPAQATSSEYAIELLAADGRLLATQPLNLLYAEEHGIEARALETAVLYPNEPIANLRIVRNEAVLAERNLTTGAAFRQAPAAMTETAETITLTWGDNAPTVVRYTVDDGLTWSVVALHNTSGSVTVSKAELPGGNGRFELISANTQAPVAQTIVLDTPLPNQSPVADIRGPELIEAGSITSLVGVVSDAESSGDLEQTWLINGEPAGDARTLSLSQLTVGEHLIQLIVTDAEGAQTTAGYVVNVTP